MGNPSLPNIGAVIPRGTDLTASGIDGGDNYAAIDAVMTSKPTASLPLPTLTLFVAEPSATPQRPEDDSADPECDVESAIWIFDAESRDLTAQWVGYGGGIIFYPLSPTSLTH